MRDVRITPSVNPPYALGLTNPQTPLTPRKVWKAIQEFEAVKGGKGSGLICRARGRRRWRSAC
jgi:hypothetical protein